MEKLKADKLYTYNPHSRDKLKSEHDRVCLDSNSNNRGIDGTFDRLSKVYYSINLKHSLQINTNVCEVSKEAKFERNLVIKINIISTTKKNTRKKSFQHVYST